MNPRPVLLALLACPALLTAAVVGTNPPAAPLTAERIAALPAEEQPAWRDYLARSQKLREADRKFFADELKAHNLAAPLTPREGRGGLGFNRPAEWFATGEARTLADHVISFQTPAGGWSKNLNYADHARQPGEHFAPGNAASPASAAASAKAPGGDNDQPADPGWHYVGTFDNNATTSQLRFLARVATAADGEQGAPYRAAVLRGLDYIFAAQFPNGGFPQVYPLEGGYHDAITFNDNALINVLTLLRDVAGGEAPFAFVPADTRARAAKSVQRGINCILRCQVHANGLAVWCQQHDALTLAPASARNYEMPALCSSESDDVMLFLMSLPNPSNSIVYAVQGAAAWFERTALRDVAYRFVPGQGRSLVPEPGAGPLWARYYEIGTDRPLFGDRDKSIHDQIEEISLERRNGYSWFNNDAVRVLERYAEWARAHPIP
jgi:PelA/Pel-15E family pectate lyase